jgi:hypothetical protein
LRSVLRAMGGPATAKCRRICELSAPALIDGDLSVHQVSDLAWSLSRGAPDVGSNLRVFAENPVSRLTVWTPQREPQCAQPAHLSFRGFDVTADDSSCGRTMIDQHEAPPFLRPRQASAAPSALGESQNSIIVFFRLTTHSSHHCHYFPPLGAPLNVAGSSWCQCIDSVLIAWNSTSYAGAPRGQSRSAFKRTCATAMWPDALQ